MTGAAAILAPPAGCDDVRRVRVLIVDDSAVARAFLGRVCTDDLAMDVVAALGSARAAIEVLGRERVDVVLLDLDMPGTDGLTALPDLLAAGAGARILVVSARAGQGAAATVQALALGAADTLAKPEPGAALAEFTAGLADRIGKLARMDAVSPVARAEAAAAVHHLRPFALVAIAASTGGIHALSGLLRQLPTDMRAPILVTQHLPPPFMPYFAAQLAVLAGRPCAVAEDGAPVLPGRMLVAPGTAHLTVSRGSRGGLVSLLDTTRAASGCLPSADPMFASVAREAGDAALGVVLSGMGRDGAIGAAALVAAGGQLLAQDAASSVVWGMPGAVADRLADAVLPPAAIGAAIAAAGAPR